MNHPRRWRQGSKPYHRYQECCRCMNQGEARATRLPARGRLSWRRVWSRRPYFVLSLILKDCTAAVTGALHAHMPQCPNGPSKALPCLALLLKVPASVPSLPSKWLWLPGWPEPCTFLGSVAAKWQHCSPGIPSRRPSRPSVGSSVAGQWLGGQGRAFESDEPLSPSSLPTLGKASDT